MVIVLITENGCHQYLCGYGWGSVVATSYHGITTYYMNGFFDGLAGGWIPYVLSHRVLRSISQFGDIVLGPGWDSRAIREERWCEMWLKREWWTLFLWVMHIVIIMILVEWVKSPFVLIRVRRRTGEESRRFTSLKQDNILYISRVKGMWRYALNIILNDSRGEKG